MVAAGQALAYLAAIGLMLGGFASLLGGERTGAAGHGRARWAGSQSVRIRRPSTVLDQTKGASQPTRPAIELRRFRNRTAITFTEAEHMKLRAGIGRLRLEGPMTDATGVKKPRVGVFLGFTGAAREDGQHHQAAQFIPSSLARLNDDVLVYDQMQWADAVRFARFTGFDRAWTNGRPTITP